MAQRDRCIGCVTYFGGSSDTIVALSSPRGFVSSEYILVKLKLTINLLKNCNKFDSKLRKWFVLCTGLCHIPFVISGILAELSLQESGRCEIIHK